MGHKYKKHHKAEKKNISENVNGCVLALIASILISHVSFTAYENIHFRDLNGEIDYSTNPEESIAISSLYIILLFFINLIGAIELYKRVKFL